jgi:hypothetical protein
MAIDVRRMLIDVWRLFVAACRLTIDTRRRAIVAWRLTIDGRDLHVATRRRAFVTLPTAIATGRLVFDACR